MYAVELPADIRQGCTGLPVIDEAVRTLYATGMLHNHARMWLASYVVHLRKVHWRCGADWLYGHLLDGDLASNHLSWQWVAEHPRFYVNFTPTSASWLNRVERFFRDITSERLRNGVFRSSPELTTAIKEYITLLNKNPKPFVWTAKARYMLPKVMRANSRLSTKQNEALH